MEFRIPIVHQEAYSDTQRESRLGENFEEARLEGEPVQRAYDSDHLRWRAEATVLSPKMTFRVCVHKPILPSG